MLSARQRLADWGYNLNQKEAAEDEEEEGTDPVKLVKLD
jgi:hypothetical protein